MTEIILFTAIIIQAISHFVERRDLYNRIMCRSLPEYKSGKPPVQVPSAHDRVLKNWRKTGDE